MAYRKLNNIKHKIEQATIKIGAKNGIHAVSARDVAAECDISTHTIYTNFPSMENLIDFIADRFERRHMNEAVKLSDQGVSLGEMFDEVLDGFIKDKRETLYFSSYINEKKGVPMKDNPREGEYLSLARKILKNDELSDEAVLFVWNYVVSVLFFYAQKIIKKFIPNSETTRKEIKKLVFEGLNAIIK